MKFSQTGALVPNPSTIASGWRDNIRRMALVPPPPPISIEEVERLSKPELRFRVNQWFDHLRTCSVDLRAGVVAQAEFYMRELERRENAEIAARDYTMAMEDRNTSAGIAARDLALAERSHKMEWSVIGLIGLEIIIALVGLGYGIHEGNEQQKVWEQMGKNTQDAARILSSQGGILSNMNANTHDTVDAVGKLQGVQNNSLAAQKDTLSSIGRMNKQLQQQLDLAFTVNVAVTAEQAAKRIIITNLTKTAIYVWGVKYGDEPPLRFTDERFVAPGVGQFFTVEKVFDDPLRTIPKGSSSRQVTLDFYFLSADGKPWVAKGFLTEVWEGDAMKIYPNTTSVTQEAWPADVR
jgi:hypothetical protein